MTQEAPERGLPPLRTKSPRRGSKFAQALILTVTGGGIAVIARQMPAAAHWTGIEFLSAAGLALATLVAELFPLHLRHRTEVETFSVTDVVWTAALILAPSSTLLIAVAAGVLLSQTFRRQPARKIAFNVGRFVVAMWAAAALFRDLCQAGRALMDRVETQGDFHESLKLVTRMRDASTAEIVTVRDGVAMVHEASGSTTVVPQPPGTSGSSTPAAYHLARPG